MSTARELATQGLDAYDAGDYEAAATKLSQAYSAVRVPTLALYKGRALEHLGRWVEAAETYLEATRLDATGSDAALQAQAKQEAQAARAALVPRIPWVEIAIEGVEPSEVEVTVDGVAFLSSLFLTGKMIDPGVHEIVGRHGGEEARTTVTTVEGQRATATLRFGGSASTDPGHPSLAPDAEGAKRSGGHRVAGWLAIGVGGAALVTGGVTGAMVFSQKSKLEAGDCLDRHCGPSEDDAVSRYNTLRMVSTASFVVGGVAVAAGTTLLVVSPREDASARRLRPWVGWGSAGVEGRF